VREWLKEKTNGPVVLQLFLSSKFSSQLTFEVKVQNTAEDSNVSLPSTFMKETVFGYDKKALAHFIKIDPEAALNGQFTFVVTNNWQPQVEANVNPMAAPQDESMPPLVSDVGSGYNVESQEVSSTGNMMNNDEYWCNQCQRLVLTHPKCADCQSDVVLIEDGTDDFVHVNTF
jgi:hypothetical protein